MEIKYRSAFVCTSCGAIHPKWQGQCKDCGEWNTLAEERVIKSGRRSSPGKAPKPSRLGEVAGERVHGYRSGILEFDRVLGGELLPGSTILLAGEPGIGKSTLALQVAEAYAGGGCEVLYVTGEESIGQLKRRSERLSIIDSNISAISLTDLDQILAVVEEGRYQLVVIDSIQTVSAAGFDSAPGTVGQIRESAGRLIEVARKDDAALLLIGHVTKEGLVAGPKILEHMG